MEAITLVESAPAEAVQQRWSTVSRVGFRFCFIYFSIYCVGSQIINSVFPIPKVDVPDWTTIWPIRATIFWVGAHVFGAKLPLVYQGSGSGDKVFDWVAVSCILVTAVAGTAVWSVLDCKRQNYTTLHKWFWLFLRLCLASQMFIYGMMKAVPLQMPYPFLSRLIEPFGNMSPMGVLWFSVGAAPGYETFAGCAELTAGLLLIFPRTITLGTLICLADMTQVFVLNMTYDVPVKQFSFHLIVISALLLLPDAKRLANVFLLNRSAEALQRTSLFAGRRAQRLAGGVLSFLWLWMLGCGVYGIWDSWHQYGPGAAKSPLYGIWNVQSYTEDGQPKPLLATDPQNWRRIIFEFPGYMQIQRMDDSLTGFPVAIDGHANTLTLTNPKDKNATGKFTFTRPAADRLTLDGTMTGHQTALQLQRMDEKKFLLESRGFHWVQDYPFNR
jgi:uncharacterized membrane protein YphA (DoxX/SURF4 family)